MSIRSTLHGVSVLPSSRTRGARCSVLRRAFAAPAAIALAASLAPAADTRFVEVTAASGIDHVVDAGPTWAEGGKIFEMMQAEMGNGLAVGDYDRDGDVDVLLLGHAGTPNRLFRNELDTGSTTFVDVTAEVGGDALAMGFMISRTAQFADLDDDGWLDLVIAADTEEGLGHSKIFRNDGGERLVDVTSGSGFETHGWLRCGLAVADYDLDGRLDLYVTNWGAGGSSGRTPFPGHNLLFRNLGDFEFEDVTLASGLGELGRDSFQAVFTDFTGNGYPDLYVAIDHTTDEFYFNEGGSFLRVTSIVGATHVGNDMGAACGDIDDDLDLDVFATNITDRSGRFGTGAGNVLYVNRQSEEGVVAFVDEAGERGVFDTLWGWGTKFFDVDNDADLDLVAVNGFDVFIEEYTLRPPNPMIAQPAQLYVNDGDGYFDFVEASGFDDPDDQRALAVFDYDRDGDQDVLIGSMRAPVRLLENVGADGTTSAGLSFVQAPGSNRDGVGVTIYATVGGVVKRRDVMYGDSFLAGGTAELHLGLDGADAIEKLVVEWTDGSESTYFDVPGGRRITVYQIPGDADRDGRVTVADRQAMQACFKGRSTPVAPGCDAFDFDLDGRIGTDDLQALQGDRREDRAESKAKGKSR